jgi:outer membrane protein
MLMCGLFAGPVDAAGKVYTLKDAYQSALSMNENVKIAEENLFQSESIIDQAWAHVYPGLSARTGYTQYNKSLGQGDFVFQPLGQFQAALVLTQPLYTGGRTLAALRIAQQLREANTNNLSTTKQDTMLKVAEAYYGVVKAEKRVEVNRRSLERMERHKKVTDREAATRRTKANVSAMLRATTLVNQARINLVRAEDSLKIARAKLSLESKLPPEPAVAEPETLKQPAETLDQLKEIALTARPDYAASKQNMKVAEEFVTVVRGAHHPQVSAEAAMQYQNSHPETAFDGTIYYGAIRVQIPIFEGGLLKAETSEARSKVRQAEFKTSSLKRSIENEVHDAYINVQTLNTVLETARMQMKYAKDNFDAVEGLFREGLVTSLSMIDAEQALSQAEQEVVNSTYDQQLSILRLKKSIGTLEKES